MNVSICFYICLSRHVYRDMSIVLSLLSYVHFPVSIVLRLLWYIYCSMTIILCILSYVDRALSIVMYPSSYIHLPVSIVISQWSYVLCPMSFILCLEIFIAFYLFIGDLGHWSGLILVLGQLSELRNQCIWAYFFSPISHFVFSKSMLQTYYIIQKQLKKWESSGSVNQRWGPSSLVNRTTSRNYIFKRWLYVLWSINENALSI